MLRRREAKLSLATSTARTSDSTSLAKMFISSMARRNAETQKKIESRRQEMKRKDTSSGFMTAEDTRLLSAKGISKGQMVAMPKRKYGNRVNSASLPEHLSQFSVRPAETYRSHVKEIQPSLHRLDLGHQLDEEESNVWSDKADYHPEWYVNPVHRPIGPENQFSELVRRQPLAASVVKAEHDGTLQRDYEEDISAVPLEEFDMDLFKSADMEIYRHEIRKSLKLHSPYKIQLAKLKQDKLKLEEAYLLQLKCEAELEETRAPKPGWYELKTRQFSSEHRKHNNLLTNSKDWKSLIDYRNSLIEASARWENLYQ